MALDCDFLILNRLPGLYSAQRFLSEIKRLNLKAELVTPEWLIEHSSHFEMRDHSLGVLYRQGDFNFWPTQTALMKLPFKILNSPAAFIKARDKWLSTQAWQKQNIPVPLTLPLVDPIDISVDLSLADLFQMTSKKLGLPFLLKKRFSSQGRGVFLIKDKSSFITILEQDALQFKNANALEIEYFKKEGHQPSTPVSPLWLQRRRWIVQFCIQECLGHDIRVFVVKDKFYTIERKNMHSFRSNLHQGGKAIAACLSPTEKKLCKLIHTQSNLTYSGIDFLRTTKGPLFLEVNPSPGFEGIERTYNQNIAADLLTIWEDDETDKKSHLT